MKTSRSGRGTMNPKRMARPWLKPSAAPSAQVRFDLAIDCRQRLVGREQHDDVRRRRRFEHGGGGNAVGLGPCSAGRSVAQADDDIDPAVLQVERLRAALVAIADDRDALACERGGVDVGVALGVHEVSLLRLGQQRQRPIDAIAFERVGKSRPVGGRLVGEPGILALGVAPRRLLAGVDRLRPGQFAVDEARRAPARRSRASPAAGDRGCGRAVLDLVDRARLDHGRESPVAALVEPGARRQERSAAEARSSRRSRLRRSSCHSASVRPVDLTTSSARAMRVVSPGLSDVAATGSSGISAARFSATPAARTSARIAGSIAGTGAIPSSRVRR